ncbi:MAG: GT4 family glycosyltransferase PelF [Candidatus Omnitrophota bacterium]|nr:GT4 family glycosyltransferase PelF [Candidatus Omnitrophota bacterium]MDZ4243256.1 GT4 family glycosyltransferase PelF [Candidatus Omnitrophota bacterium]
MRILQILPELNVGGVETGTVDFAKYLKKHGYESVVVSNGGPMVAELDKEGIRHYALPVHRKNPWVAFRCVMALRKIIRQEKIDIVHARSRVPAWVSYFACRSTTAQFITTCHGYYSNKFPSRVMGWGKLVIVPSEVIGRHMIEDFRVSMDSIRCIPRSVDLSRFTVRKPDTSDRPYSVISIVGRITPLKGHIYFLKAMARVVRQRPYVKIWIIGDAPEGKENYRQDLETLVQRLGLQEYVEFLGNRRDVPELLANTDVLVMASIEPESFGRVIVEAQAVGVPVVATEVGGVMEIIEHEKTGLLVMPQDPDAMAQAVLRVLSDRKLASHLVAAARKKLEQKYTLDHMAGQTLKVYHELLEMTHILVIKLSSIGDVILVTASLKALRDRFPLAKIYCLVGEDARQVLRRCPYLEGVIPWDTKGRDGGFWGIVRLAQKLRDYKFDKVVDFQNNARSHFLGYLLFARDTYGYNNGFKKLGFFLNRPVKDPNPRLPPVEHQFQVLRMLDIPYRKDVNLNLWPSSRDHAHAQVLLDSEWMGSTAQIVGINIAASGKWETKNWPVEHIAALCDMLGRENVRVLVTGIEKDREAANRLLKLAKSKPAVFIGKTDLMELASLIKRCNVYISPDSAPMHIAAAMRVPFIALFGPTDSARHVPPAKDYVVMEKSMACKPCYSPACKILTHACMKEITPEEVFKQVKRFVTVSV